MVALAIEILRNLLVLGQDELVVVGVDKQDFLFPKLIYFGGNQFAFQVFKLAVDGILLQVENLAGECLTQVEDGAAAKLGEIDDASHFFAHLTFRVDLASLGQPYLLVGIFNSAIFHHFEVLIDFAVALVGVYNHVEIVVATKHLCNHAAERFLKHVDDSGLVDTF